MAIKDCIGEIQKLVGDELSAQDIEDIAKDVDRRARANKARDRLLSDKEALDKAAEDWAGDATKAAKMESRNRAFNIIIHKKIEEFGQRAIAGGMRADLALEAINVGSNRKVMGGRLAAYAKQQSVTRHLVGGLLGDLEKAGLLEFMSRRLGIFGGDAGVLDRDIARALYSIGEDGKVRADVSKEAKGIAEIVNKWQEVARLRSNRAGSFVGRIPGYIMRQSHDMLKIRKMGYEAWSSLIRPLLDQEKTFGGSDPEHFLQGAYDALASGIHQKSDGATSDLVFKGPGNLAKKISQERVLHFKGGDEFMAYNDRAGTTSLIEGIVAGLHRSGRDIGLMETWGTNPKAMFDKVREEWALKYRTEHPDWAQKLREPWLDHQFAVLDGSAQMVGNTRIAQWAAGIRAAMSMSKLGGSAISSISDVATAASELSFQGENLGTAYTGLLANLVQGRGSREARILTADIGVGVDGWLGAIQTRFNSQDDLPGVSTNLMRLFFKANLQTWWTDTMKIGLGKMMSARAAIEAANPWAKIDPSLRDALSLYGIDGPKWEVMRKAAQRIEDGKAYLTPEGIRELPDGAFSPLGSKTARQAQGLRDELSTMLQAFYTDRADVGVVTPGAKEQAMLTQGTMRGTWMGEATRFIMQFKAFPLSFLTKVIGRDMGGLGFMEAILKGKGDLLGIGHTIAATTVLGMIALQTKEVLKGKSPRDTFSGKWTATWRAAMLQGGGLGIYGDYFFGEVNRFGGGPLETAAGPAFGTASDALELWGEIRSGEDPTADAIRLGVSNAPFMNLFYTRMAMDYLVLYNLQEMANPGYLRRMEKRVKRENDQEFILPPSQYAVGQ